MTLIVESRTLEFHHDSRWHVYVVKIRLSVFHSGARAIVLPGDIFELGLTVSFFVPC